MPESRVRRFLGGLAAGIAGHIVTFVVGFLATPVLLSRLGAQQLGAWYVAGTLLAYLGLLELGVSALVPREVAFALGRSAGDLAKVRAVTSSALRVAVAQFPVVALGTVICFFLLPFERALLFVPLLIAAIVYVVLYPFRLYQGVLTGLQDLGFVGATTTIASVCGTGLGVLLVVGGFGLRSLAIAWGATQLAIAGACIARLRSRFPEAFPDRPSLPTWSEIRHWLGRGLWVNVNQIATLLRSGTDLLIIARLLGPAAAVPYVISSKLIGVLGVFPGMIVASAQPALAELRFAVDRPQLLRTSDALTSATVLVSAGLGCIIGAANRPFVGGWVGSQQFAGHVVTGLLVANMVLRHESLSTTSTLFCLGHERRLAILVVLDGVFTVVVTAFGTFLFGLPGAAAGPLAGTLFVSLPYALWTLARETGVTTRSVVLATVKRNVPALALAAALGTVSALLDLSSLFHAALSAIVSGGVFALLFHRRALRPPIVDYARPLLARLSRRLANLDPPSSQA